MPTALTWPNPRSIQRDQQRLEREVRRELRLLTLGVGATRRGVPRGQERVVRIRQHAAALEKVVLAAVAAARPCKRMPRQPSDNRACDRSWDLSTSHRPTEPGPTRS